MIKSHERKERITKLKNKIGTQNGPLTVALIGTPGSGKSSLINTIIASITGEYRQYARAGDFGGEGIKLNHHLNVYFKEDYLLNIEDKNLMQYNFPTLLDVVGFMDTNDAVTRRILQMVLSGRIPPDTKLLDVAKLLRHNPEDPLRKYQCNVDMEVDRIIFVVSASCPSLPLQLMNALHESITSLSRDISVFGVITKIDKIYPFDQKHGYKEFVEEFKSQLRIRNWIHENLLKCTNYCDDNLNKIREGLQDHIPELEIPVLEFLQEVLKPIAYNRNMTGDHSQEEPPQSSREHRNKSIPTLEMEESEESEGEILSENYDDVMKNKMEVKREEVFKKLKLRIGTDSPPLTVAIIGTPGSGKSSFINTIITSFTKEWRNYATVGDRGGSGETITQHLICHEKENYLPKEKAKLMKHNFPILVDMAGFTDTNDVTTKHLLDLIFSGRIHKDAKISDVIENIKNKKNLKEIYPCDKRNIKVDRVIFVVSASNRSPPSNLMRSLYSSIVSGPRAIPVFGVITKIDKLQDTDKKDFEKLVSEFKWGLGILDINLLQCTNYCDANLQEVQEGLADHLPHIDIPVLQFLRQVLDPVQRVIDNEEYRKKHSTVFEKLYTMFESYEYLKVPIFILFLAVFAMLCLKGEIFNM